MAVQALLLALERLLLLGMLGAVCVWPRALTGLVAGETRISSHADADLGHHSHIFKPWAGPPRRTKNEKVHTGLMPGVGGSKRKRGQWVELAVVGGAGLCGRASLSFASR
jgi:hypothetical protein